MTILFCILGVVTYFALVVLVGWVVGFNQLGNRTHRFLHEGTNKPMNPHLQNRRARTNIHQLHCKVTN